VRDPGQDQGIDVGHDRLQRLAPVGGNARQPGGDLTRLDLR
jgi:hypothetical protein